MTEKFGHEIGPNEIVIKDTNVLRGLMERNFAALLIVIICEVAKKFGIFVTESYRKKRHPNDLHGVIPVRALDIRSWIYPDKLAYEIMQWINQKWVYDSNRPDKNVAIIHKTKNGGYHFHIQVHPNTKLRNYI